MSDANNHGLALVNTFFSPPKGGVSYTFNRQSTTRIDYIQTRQHDRSQPMVMVAEFSCALTLSATIYSTVLQKPD